MQVKTLQFIGPSTSSSAHVERILRSLPQWFGIEASLRQYVSDSARHPTFVAIADEPVAFMTVRQQFPRSWELHCIAVEAAHRDKGIGRLLHRHVEAWLAERQVDVLQVKTLAPSHPSAEYALTRGFYEHLGYCPVEVFPQLWGDHLPVLQLVKWVGAQAVRPDPAQGRSPSSSDGTGQVGLERDQRQ